MENKIKKNNKKEMKTIITLMVIAFGIILVSPMMRAVEPFGGSVTAGTPETAPADTAGNNSAVAGNITEITISAYSTTQTWQGYFGNVSGTIQLADANDNVLYNWTLASPEGEVYASTNSSITWTNIQCFNFTADGTKGAESGGGTTSLYGTNLSELETAFNIVSDDVDGVNETFGIPGTSHDLFYTANQEFAAGECLSTEVFGDSGEGIDNEFEEVLLYEPTSRSVIFASLLEEGNVLGYDTGDHDFEMLVLEDGHGTDTATTTYYFFVELE